MIHLFWLNHQTIVVGYVEKRQLICCQCLPEVTNLPQEALPYNSEQINEKGMLVSVEYWPIMHQDAKTFARSCTHAKLIVTSYINLWNDYTRRLHHGKLKHEKWTSWGLHALHLTSLLLSTIVTAQSSMCLVLEALS